MTREGSCKKLARDLTAYHQGEIAPERRAGLEEHLEACASCRRQLDAIRNVFGMAGAIEDLVPSMRFKRNMVSVLRQAGRPAPEFADGLFFKIQSAGAFLLHRLRTSGRFQLAAVSVGVHVALLLLLSLVIVPGVAKRRELVVDIEPVLGDLPENLIGPPDGGPLAADDRPEDLPDIPEAPPVPQSVTVYDDSPVPPSGGPVERSRLTALLGSVLDARTKELKLAACLREPGRAIESIEKALAWLGKSQEKDGSWAASRQDPAYRTGATATCLLAFLSDGHGETRGRKEYRPVVTKAIDHLLAAQTLEGPLVGLIGPPDGHYMYNHGLATLALVEAYCLDYRPARRERTKQLAKAIRRAVALIERSQTPEGGWRYEARFRAPYQNDTSVSIFQVLALAAAQSARFPVEEQVLARFSSWLRSVTGKDGLVRYRPEVELAEDAPRTLTACALFLEELLGLAAPLRDRQASAVMEELTSEEGSTARNGLLRFYSALAFRMRGRVVLDRFAPALLRTQRADGSWSASTVADDIWALHGGDRFLTALNVLTLTSAYRFPG